MSLFSWFSSKKPERQHAAPASSGLSRMESTKPYSASRQDAGGGQGQPGNRKHERMARRELLYTVVRDTMVNAGVLSSSYKFKVLSLDSRGRQFLVMVDLAQGAGGDTVRLAEIEASIAQAAKSRYDILVTAVYWRSNEHVAVGDSRGALKPSPSRPAPLAPNPEPRELTPVHAAPDAISQPAELIAAPLTRGHGRYEPLQPDEVAAFRKALASGVTGAEALSAATGGASAKAFDGSEKHGPQSYTLLTGFEDTEMAESDTPTPTALSSTQYGDLR
jgi:hypothetical protein